MMKESKLTNFQRKKLTSRLKDGKSLPVSCGPTSSERRQKPTPKPVNPPMVMNGRHLALSGKRRKETIDVIAENNKPDPFRPLPGKFISEKDKQQLQNKMAYGVEIPEPKISNKTHTLQEIYEPIDEFDEVLQQIEERRDFLKEMEDLGEGKKYSTMIETEISQKIRQLEVIDKKRSQELEQALRDKNT